MPPSENKKAIQAAQIWPLLVWAATNNQLLTYEKVGNWVGGGPRNVSEPLGVIKRYCQAKGYRALTAIVVKKRTGFPGPGGLDDVLKMENEPNEAKKLKKLAKEKMLVFIFNWMNKKPPTVSQLERYLG